MNCILHNIYCSKSVNWYTWHKASEQSNIIFLCQLMHGISYCSTDLKDVVVAVVFKNTEQLSSPAFPNSFGTPYLHPWANSARQPIWWKDISVSMMPREPQEGLEAEHQPLKLLRPILLHSRFAHTVWHRGTTLCIVIRFGDRIVATSPLHHLPQRRKHIRDTNAHARPYYTPAP